MDPSMSSLKINLQYQSFSATVQRPKWFCSKNLMQYTIKNIVLQNYSTRERSLRIVQRTAVIKPRRPTWFSLRSIGPRSCWSLSWPIAQHPQIDPIVDSETTLNGPSEPGPSSRTPAVFGASCSPRLASEPPGPPRVFDAPVLYHPIFGVDGHPRENQHPLLIVQCSSNPRWVVLLGQDWCIII